MSIFEPMKQILSLFALVLGITSAMAQAPNPQAPGIQAGPWVCDASDSTLTILWTSEVPGKAYVELEDGSTVYDVFAGRRIFRRLHSITLKGLEPGSAVRYRVCGVNVKDDSNARDPKFGDTYTGSWHTVKTLDSRADACRFSVLNDIHMRTRKYRQLAAQIDSAQTDFIFLNGDIVSAGNYVLDTLVRYTVAPLGSLSAGIPLSFARGNHEGRGNNPMLVADVFPHAQPAPFYYTFRQGPVAIIVFDAGETHEHRSEAYSGAAVFEDYLAEQIAWAQTALRQPAFQNAPVKLCLLHVPMIDHPDQNDYLLQRWLNRHMVPLLNEAGIDLMIGADLHEFMYCEKGTMGNDFPILVNDDARRLDVECAPDHSIHLSTFNADGELEFEKYLFK